MSSDDSGHTAMLVELAQSQRSRLELDLEYLYWLAIPAFLMNISHPPDNQPSLLLDPAYLNYLEYLRYLQHPDYIKAVPFPHCFYVLNCLLQPHFREQLLNNPALICETLSLQLAQILTKQKQYDYDKALLLRQQSLQQPTQTPQLDSKDESTTVTTTTTTTSTIENRNGTNQS